jgi:hypothetical protein
MVVVSLNYRFRQAFRVPARAAYDWCTDFGPEDGSLFRHRTERSVRRLTADALVLTDTTHDAGRPLRIRRLVRLDPELLSWTNTHLDGPYRHSQHWYRIRPDGPSRSHLEFEGLRLESVSGAPSPAQVRRRTEQRRVMDSAEWREFLAPALERDLRGSRPAGRRARG